MSRNRFLVTYDITADRRRDRVFKALKDVGDHLQYSVFMCDLNEREYIQLRVRLRERINANEDQVLIIDLGLPNAKPSNGSRPWALPSANPNESRSSSASGGVVTLYRGSLVDFDNARLVANDSSDIHSPAQA